MSDLPPPDDPGTRGDETRFQDLFEAHYRTVLAYARRRVAQPADAADVVAEVFTTAWRRLADVPGPPAEVAWLLGVARNTLAHQARAAARRDRLWRRLAAEIRPGPLGPAGGLPAGPGSPSEDHAVVRAALERLPAAEAETLRLVLWDGLSHTEAAQVLGCSPNAVAIRLHRARRRLRRTLAGRVTHDRAMGLGPDRPAGQAEGASGWAPLAAIDPRAHRGPVEGSRDETWGGPA